MARAMPQASRMDPHAPHVHPDRRRMHAIFVMLAAVLCFALMDSVLKILSAHYPPFQVATLRGASSLPIVLVWALATGGVRPLVNIRWGLHFFRGLLGVLMMVSFIFALRSLPLSTTYSIFFVAPLLITAMSVPFLGEKVGPRRWIAIGIGLLGVLVVLRPTGEGVLSIAGLAVLVSALAYAISAITVRLLAKTDSVHAMMFWLLAWMALGAGILAAPEWKAIDTAHWPLIVGLGIAGTLGQYAITLAFKWGEASLIAPLDTRRSCGACAWTSRSGACCRTRSRGSVRRSSSRAACTCCAAKRCTRTNIRSLLRKHGRVACQFPPLRAPFYKRGWDFGDAPRRSGPEARFSFVPLRCFVALDQKRAPTPTPTTHGSMASDSPVLLPLRLTSASPCM
jgi:drug/metabolite transporter (DMT)-like permease